MVRMGKKFFVFYVILCIYAFSNNVKKIRSGESHTLILLENGKVFGFGWNESGQVINGNSKNYKKIVEIKGIEDIVDIDAGDIHSIALRKDGIVFAWGSDFSGQLGNPDFKNFHLPVIVRMKNGEILKDIIKVAAGWDFSVALKKDGTVWTWGENKYGQLGDGSFISRRYPVKVKNFSGDGEITDIVKIECGAFHSCAINKNR
jgi:alpha-tubulin suppressor-like RCC1 family protein